MKGGKQTQGKRSENGGENKGERKDEKGTNRKKREPPPQKYVIDGIRSAVKRQGVDGVIRWEYEVQWEGYQYVVAR